MKLRVLPSAGRDLLEGYQFYEQQARGLGSHFLDCLFADIDSLENYAGIHLKYYEDYHRMLARRFPFAVYYRVESDGVVVYAVLDCRRDPAWTRERLK